MAAEEPSLLFPSVILGLVRCSSCPQSYRHPQNTLLCTVVIWTQRYRLISISSLPDLPHRRSCFELPRSASPPSGEAAHGTVLLCALFSALCIFVFCGPLVYYLSSFYITSLFWSIPSILNCYLLLMWCVSERLFWFTLRFLRYECLMNVSVSERLLFSWEAHSKKTLLNESVHIRI